MCTYIYIYDIIYIKINVITKYILIFLSDAVEDVRTYLAQIQRSVSNFIHYSYYTDVMFFYSPILILYIIINTVL